MTTNKFQVTMRSGPMAGKTFAIEAEENILGRDLANEIIISDPEVSRRHARFFIRDENVFVEDLGSTNGTFLNGDRISSPQQLRSGDVITLGESVVLIFEKISQVPVETADTVPDDVTSVQDFPPPPPQPHFEPETYQPPSELVITAKKVRCNQNLMMTNLLPHQDQPARRKLKVAGYQPG